MSRENGVRRRDTLKLMGIFGLGAAGVVPTVGTADGDYPVDASEWFMYGRTADQTGYNDNTTGPADDADGVTLDWWETLDAAVSAPAVDSDRAYVAAENLYGIDVDEGEVDWELEIDGDFWDRPALMDGNVLALERDWSGDTTHLHSVDAASGTRQWDQSVSDGAMPPVADEARAYVGDQEEVRALELSTGEEEWSYSPQEYISTLPALVDGVLYVGTEEYWSEDTPYLHAIDADSGLGQWTAEPGTGDITDLAVGDDFIFVSTDNGDVEAYDTSGSLQWAENDVADTVRHLTLDDNRLYVATHAGIIALEPTSGNQDWSQPVGPISDKPAVSTAGLFVGTSNEHVVVLEPESGDIIWHRVHDGTIFGPVVTDDRAFVGGSRTLRAHTTGKLPETTVPEIPAGEWRFHGYDTAGTGHNPTASVPDADADGPHLRWWQTFDTSVSAPAVDEDTAYVAADDIYALDTDDGSVRWQYETEDHFTGDQPVLAGDLVFGIERDWSDDPVRIHAIDPEYGTRRWDADIDDDIQHPVAGDERVFLTSGETVRARSLLSGQQEWQFELREPPATTPVLAHDRLYVGTEEYWSDDEAYVYAINAATGNAIGRIDYPDGGDVASMAASDDQLYVVFETGGIIAYDRDGNEQWSHDGSADWFDYVGTDGERVYLTTSDSSGVTALDPDDGSVLWRTSSLGRAAYPPASTPSGVLVGTEHNNVVLLDPESGDILWWRQHDDDIAGPVAVEGDVYVGGSSTLRVHAEGEMSTVEPETVGPLAWHTAGRTATRSSYTDGEPGPTAEDSFEQLWQIDTGYDITTPPASDGRVGYVAADSLFAYDLRTGDLLWEYETDDHFEYPRPTIVEDTVLAIERDWSGDAERLHAVDRQTGSKNWTAPVADGVRSPVVGDNLVFLTAGSYIEARTLSDGDFVWRFELEEDVGTDPVLSLSDGRLYIGTEAYWSDDAAHVYAINAATGNGLWRVRREGGDVTSIAVSDSGETIYVAFGMDGIVAYDRDGHEQWNHDGSADWFDHVGTDGELIYVATTDSTGLSALDADTGHLVWRTGVDDPITSRPAISDQAVFVGTVENEVIAVDADTGDRLWQRVHDGSAASPTVIGNRAYVAGESPNLRTFVDAIPPVATLGHDDEIPVDEPITFHAEESEPGDAAIAEYRWDFTGDGEVDATGEQVEYTFEEEGSHEVRLTVSDENDVVDVDREIITVSEDPDDPLEEYRNDDGVVDTTGLREGIDHWRNGDLGTDLLRDVIDAWRTGA
ncbi:hypothetical protein CV102_13450 [Natronococcus pandeyae]|uniref:PKD domain-containing protein n=1 Tax=Natronococcus pandeyae TaxID=2055836 RepID=A0A8J8TRY6_9EURY|nr:PQQ-binding-like beta-propeller repeat protein [Natronococcus pandeyae]TYL38199.1 hypothetical protein CV102_13450 [Natronococcus pandeyae]